MGLELGLQQGSLRGEAVFTPEFRYQSHQSHYVSYQEQMIKKVESWLNKNSLGNVPVEGGPVYLFNGINNVLCSISINGWVQGLKKESSRVIINYQPRDRGLPCELRTALEELGFEERDSNGQQA